MFPSRFLRSSAATMIAIAAIVTTLGHAHGPDAVEIALGSLVDAELAFARLSLEQGIRAAFLANFAADGVVFEPAPVRLQAAWAKRPAPSDPYALRLEWQPAQAGVARSGDMGFTTGPSKLTDARRPDFVRHGVFFSVWQRDWHGVWRVGIDIGTSTPAAPDFVTLGAAPRPAYAGKADAAAARTTLLALETRHHDAARSYAALLAPDARLYREGALPIARRAAVAGEVISRTTRFDWLPFELRMSKAGDMAAVYGQLHARSGTDGEYQGYYLHLWLRDAAGRWRLAYDIVNR